MLASSCLSICLSVYLPGSLASLPSAWNNSAPIRCIFVKLGICRESVEKSSVWLKHDKKNVHFTGSHMYIYINVSLDSSQDEKSFRQTL
jgi:hypothetical protein